MTRSYLSRYTNARLFEKRKRTDVFVRMSTVVGELGSTPTARDPRGFAIEFSIEDGNYDLVGGNTPIFLVRDPQKFQDFIDSQKRRFDTGMRDHNMQWDFWRLSSETAHQETFPFTDRETPRILRNMYGYGSHTFTWLNANGDAADVKYRFKTDQGERRVIPSATVAVDPTTMNYQAHR